jgi:hypothetical protein
LDQSRRGGDPYGGQTSTQGATGTSPSAGATYPTAQSPYSGGYQQPTSYQHVEPTGSTTGASTTQPYSTATPYSATTTSSYDATYGGTTTAAGSSTGATPIPSNAGGAYRPGTTGRNATALDGQTGSTATGTPATHGAGGAYPATSATTPSSANQQWSYGSGSQYPSTNQY